MPNAFRDIGEEFILAKWISFHSISIERQTTARMLLDAKLDHPNNDDTSKSTMFLPQNELKVLPYEVH